MSRFIYKNAQNLLTYSEQFDHANWPVSGTPVITPNSTVAPDGTTTADTVEDNDAAAWETCSQNYTSLTPANPYTASIYIKKNAVARETLFPMLRMTFFGSTSEANDCRVDTSTGEVSVSGVSTNPSVAVADAGDYWRISITATSTDQSNTSAQVVWYSAAGSSGSWSYDSSSIGSQIIWGAQLEQASSAGPYEKTEATANTDLTEAVTVDPEWDFKDGMRKVENIHRTRAGNRFTYKWGEFSKIGFGVNYVNSSTAAIINSWWNTNTKLMTTDILAVDITSVQLVNKSQPLEQFNKPNNTQFKGSIDLETY